MNKFNPEKHNFYIPRKRPVRLPNPNVPKNIAQAMKINRARLEQVLWDFEYKRLPWWMKIRLHLCTGGLYYKRPGYTPENVTTIQELAASDSPISTDHSRTGKLLGTSNGVQTRDPTL